MDIRSAILKAADSIEQNPMLYIFKEIYVPPCGSPGCLLGLIGGLMKQPIGENINDTCHRLFGFSHGAFYDRIKGVLINANDRNWTVNPLAAVNALRLYADKYHPAETLPQPVTLKGMPDWCRQIFVAEEAA